ncbi:autotransporter outer membrane beta-barrel domain-containing protein [Rhodoligotrophos defluvii]|uniref:autotransporter outer membrane beta-barrel domain-containing protein n=1 Tax=Rhodoligotrophos defluvii TaxID=2561934 RepID=UPI001484EA42|nr:autotransporter domain-containing protein [Rhodoligotrophos defluvii]
MAGPALAATFTVSDPTTGDPTKPNTLDWAIAQSNASGGADTIKFAPSLAGQTITLAKQLPIITGSVTIDGEGNDIKISGGNAHNIFFARADGSDSPASINVSIANLTLEEGAARGGNGGSVGYGGGGGMGAGGAIFVGKNAHVTVENVDFSDNSATGGQGGGHTSAYPGSGGGGLNGGNGGNGRSGSSGTGGGGGGGYGAHGAPGPSGTGGSGGGPNAGAGGTSTTNAQNGGDFSGGGGGGSNSSGGNQGKGGDGGFGGGGGGGGTGGGNASTLKGGHGGFGGGGGGAANYGGGGTYSVGGSGGFGGGGGGTNASTPGGFGGGNGGRFGGGGGAGFGGAVFVESGGTISFSGDGEMAGGSARHGEGRNGGTNGLGLGSGFYLHGTTGLTFTPGTGQTITIADDIASDAYAPGHSSDDDPAGDGKDTGVTKTGAGRLVLGGNNTYVGGTRIQQGTLGITRDAALGHATSAVTISNNAELLALGTFTTDRTLTLSGGGTLSAEAGHVFTIAGQVTGTGGVTKAGAGTVVFGNDTNNYSGTTTVSEGTLRLGTDNALPQGPLHVDAAGTFDLAGFDQTLAALSGDAGSRILLGSGDLVVNQSTSTTFSGTVSGAGTFTKSGSGTLTIAGALDNTGGIFMDGGTLAAGAANVFGDGILTITSGTVALNGHDQTVIGLQGTGGTLGLGGATFTLAQNINTTYAGAIAGSGSFVKAGSGTFTYTGTGSTSGTIDVAQGKFHLAGSLANAAGMIESGAELYGTGTIGSLHVKGRLAAGTLSPEQIEINNDGPPTAGTLTVNGNLVFDPGSMLFGDMALDGNLNLIKVNGTTTINGGTVHILDDDSVFDETATYVLIDSSGGITGTFNDLVTDFAFLEPHLSYTATQVRISFTPDFEPEFYTRNAASIGTVVADLMQSNAADGTLALLIEKLAETNRAEAEHALSAMNAEIYSDVSAVARRLLTGGDRLVTNRFLRDPGPRLQFWTEHQYRAVDLSFDGNASGGLSQEHHQLFGADMAVAQGAGRGLIGLYGGIAWANLALDDIAHRAAIAGPIAGLYGQWTLGSLRLYGRGSVALPRVDAKRHFGAGGIHLTATGDYRMTAGGGNLGVSYDTETRGVKVTPFAEFGLQYLSRPAITEQRADNAGLLLDGAKLTTGDARLGAKVALKPVALDEAWQLKPFLAAAYIRTFGDAVDTTHAAFIGAPEQPFTAKGVQIGKDAGDFAASLELVRLDGFANIRLGYGLGLANHQISHTFGLAGSVFW